MDIETRLTNLERHVELLAEQLDHYIKFQNNEKKYDMANINGVRKGVGDNSADIETNIENIAENDGAICDVAELSDVNSQAIDDLAEMVDELSKKVEELEG